MNRAESHAITRLDFALSKKTDRRARMASHESRARAEVVRAIEEARGPEDADMAIKARVSAYALALNHTSGPASLVAFLGQIAGRFGAEVSVPKGDPGLKQRVFGGGE